MSSQQRTRQDLRQFTLPDGFRGRSAVLVQVWWIIQATAFAMSPQVAFGWRRWLLRLFGAQIGTGVKLRASCRTTYPWNLKIGDHSQIGDNVEFYNLAPVYVGEHVVISQGCYICTAGHDPARADFAIYRSPVVIQDQVWLAAQCFVMPGLTIAEGTFAMVRSLITRSTEEGAVVSGAPATQAGWRDDLIRLGINEHGYQTPPLSK